MNEKRLRWILFFFVILVGCFTSIWLKDLNAEQLLFNLHVSMKGANGSAVWRCLLFRMRLLSCWWLLAYCVGARKKELRNHFCDFWTRYWRESVQWWRVL